MEPRFELARVLAEAVAVAAGELADPIDKVTVSNNRIFVSAGRNRLELSYVHHNAYSPEGAVMPGSGHWSVMIVGVAKANRFAAVARIVMEKLGLSSEP